MLSATPIVIHDRVRKSLLPILPAALDIARRHGLPADYKAGHRPRHIAGNLRDPSEVELILLLAEPGSAPFPEELNRTQETWLEDITCDGVGNGGNRLELIPIKLDHIHRRRSNLRIRRA